jgi:hypothetical protein
MTIDYWAGDKSSVGWLVCSGMVIAVIFGSVEDNFRQYFDKHRILSAVIMAINPMTVILLTGTLMFVSLLLAVPLFVASTISIVSFGTDLYWLPLFCQVRVLTEPTGSLVITCPTSCGWGHSSVHDNSDAFREIGLWLTQERRLKT